MTKIFIRNLFVIDIAVFWIDTEHLLKTINFFLLIQKSKNLFFMKQKVAKSVAKLV